MRIPDRRTCTLTDLHRTHAGAIFRSCLRMLSDSSEAEDAVQETYLRAYLLLRNGAGTPGRRWLSAIARYVCLHMLRTRRRKGLVPVGATDPSCDDSQHRRLLARSHLEWLFTALDERDKRILTSVFSGMTQTEAARRLGISRRAVVKRIASVRERYSPWPCPRRAA